ncbi:MAG TPA: methyltransferase domain-containing protein [Sedimentisphaerales bacterium]|nr:methyltransferase domain-containing protein [Sedimentisphaerales bacterium]
MTWTAQTSQGYEAQKCRYRIASYLRGTGLDLGAGDGKVCKEAIGIDIGGTAADIKLDLSEDRALGIFADGSFDYIFSSHCLEDFKCTEAILREWWRVIRPGGHLILYGPDRDYYPNVGTTGANPNHQVDLYWQDVWKILEGFGNAKKISASRHNDSNEYSWQLVIQKKQGLLKRLLPTLIKEPFGANDGQICFPRQKVTNKECLVIRYGAYGDAVWVTPVLKRLKAEGYHVVYNCTPYSAEVLRACPWIDEFLVQGRDVVPNVELGTYWEEISKGFERVINLCQSVERTLLLQQGRPEYHLSHKKRHEMCNVNYQDRTMEVAGYPEAKGQLPELHFTEMEEALAQLIREAHKDKFLILWSLSGSSLHKCYPWTHIVAARIHQSYPDAVIVTVGDEMCKMLESWSHPNTLNKSGVWTIRQSMLMTKYADLVIGPETGVLNAASCYPTPKIVLLSHSSPENLTKYWQNCVPLAAPAHCQPCHRLIYDGECLKSQAQVKAVDGQLIPFNVRHEGAKCMEALQPERILETIEKFYRRWKNVRPKETICDVRHGPADLLSAGRRVL